MTPSPFALDQDDAFQRWREQKLAQAPTAVEELIVEINDPRNLTKTEYQALLERCQRANMAVYISRTADDPDKAIPQALGARFGLQRLDHNRGADEDAITSLTVQTDALHRDYIPYSNRPIAWHTDGYYNHPDFQIWGLILHCVQPAAEGGTNDVLDHELVYLRLREQNPQWIHTLMQPDCMTIPGHQAPDGSVRPDRPGPVFHVSADQRLHMRYTHRARNIHWRDDAATAEALAALRAILADPAPYQFSVRLESGWGLLSNNVLHTRSGFTDGATPRLLYRARYYDRIVDTC